MNELNNIKSDLEEIVGIIIKAKENAFRKVNEELIEMYWTIGKKLSENSQKTGYGDKYIDGIAKLIHNIHPELKGFNRRGLYRMKQFYEVYCDDQIVSPLVTQLSWTNNLLIISSTKTREEREFYVKLAIKERYSKRELERQIQSSYYERAILSKTPLMPQSIQKLSQCPFLDSYIIEFLDLPEKFDENNFRKSLISQMKRFVLELGKDFAFVGEEYKVQVGNTDYFIDLLFTHRELRCLVAIELKIGKFKPEYISKMDFYLEALDRQIKKEYENPSVGLILCASKDDEIVEYSLSRTLSPLMVSEYQLKLPSKDLLQKKLQELIQLNGFKEKDTNDEDFFQFHTEEVAAEQ